MGTEALHPFITGADGGLQIRAFIAERLSVYQGHQGDYTYKPHPEPTAVGTSVFQKPVRQSFHDLSTFGCVGLDGEKQRHKGMLFCYK